MIQIAFFLFSWFPHPSLLYASSYFHGLEQLCFSLKIPAYPFASYSNIDNLKHP